MQQDNIPLPHPDPWIDLTRLYVTGAVQALRTSGLRIDRSWLDPAGPRDATIVYTVPGIGPRALVWDEVTGWRHGAFEGGRQGIRTALSGVTYLGGGIIPGGPELTRRLLVGAAEPAQEYRSVTDLHDGLDDRLRCGFG